MTRQVTTEVTKKIASWEGNVLFAYDDAFAPPRPARVGDKLYGTLTIGNGHTGTDVYAGQTITEAESLTLLDQDLRSAEDAAGVLVTVPLDDNQFGAVVDLIFNNGSSAVKGSHTLALINSGDFAAVPAAFMTWDHTHINGVLVESPGLKKRCANRAALWLENVVPSGQVAAPPKAPPQGAGVVVGGVVGTAVVAVGAGASAVHLPVYIGVLALLVIILAAVSVFEFIKRSTL